MPDMRKYVKKLCCLKIEQKVPIWQRCICGCFVACGAPLLLWVFIMYFIVDPVPPSLNFLMWLPLYSLAVPVLFRVTLTGKSFEGALEGKISPWLRAGFGLGAVISLVGEIRILVSVINGETVLSTKDEIYFSVAVLLTCAFAYIAVRGRSFSRAAPAPTIAATDSPVDSMPPSKPT
jgi:hypothetical protein